MQAIEIGFDVGRLDVVDLFRVNQAEAGNDSAVGIGEVRVHDPGRDEVLDCCRAAGGDPRRPRVENQHIEDRSVIGRPQLICCHRVGVGRNGHRIRFPGQRIEAQLFNQLSPGGVGSNAVALVWGHDAAGDVAAAHHQDDLAVLNALQPSVQRLNPRVTPLERHRRAREQVEVDATERLRCTHALDSSAPTCVAFSNSRLLSAAATSTAAVMASAASRAGKPVVLISSLPSADLE